MDTDPHQVENALERMLPGGELGVGGEPMGIAENRKGRIRQTIMDRPAAGAVRLDHIPHKTATRSPIMGLELELADDWADFGTRRAEGRETPEIVVANQQGAIAESW
jgi:hypothetical protein